MYLTRAIIIWTMIFDFVVGDADILLEVKFVEEKVWRQRMVIFCRRKIRGVQTARPLCDEHKASAFRTLKRLGPSLPSQLYREVCNFACETTIREQCFTPLFDVGPRRAASFSLSLCSPFACECAQTARMRARQTFPLISWSRTRGIIERERENAGRNKATPLSSESHPAIFAQPPALLFLPAFTNFTFMSDISRAGYFGQSL